MTLHPAILAGMLEDEVTAARERLGGRISELTIVGSDVVCRVEGTNVGTALMRFVARDYDAEPLQFAVIAADGHIADPSGWPGTVAHGSIHPVVERPWSCTQGTYEYHSFPGHTADRWDAHRNTLRLPQLLDHLVRKAGR